MNYTNSYYKQLTNYVKFKERYANNFEMPNFYVKHNDISYDCLIKTEIYKRYILNEKITIEINKYFLI